MANSEIRFNDQNLADRIERVASRRRQPIARTTRDLLHERLLQIEQHGDPAVVEPDRDATNKPKSDAA